MKRYLLHQWMYRGQHPNWIAKFLNRVDATVAAMGIAPNYLIKLEVTGRKSGRTISFPLVMTGINGQRYLVSMLGEDAQWVQNVHAANGKAVIHSGSREVVQLEDVPVAERASILKTYLRRAPGARPHMPVSKNAPISEFEKIAGEFPVFRVISNGAA